MIIKYIKALVGVLIIFVGAGIFFSMIQSVSISIWVLLFALFLVIVGLQFILDSIEVNKQ